MFFTFAGVLDVVGVKSSAFFPAHGCRRCVYTLGRCCPHCVLAGMVASLLYMSACVLLQLFASLFGRVFACVIPPYSVQGAAFSDTWR